MENFIFISKPSYLLKYIFQFEITIHNHVKLKILERFPKNQFKCQSIELFFKLLFCSRLLQGLMTRLDAMVPNQSNYFQNEN